MNWSNRGPKKENLKKYENKELRQTPAGMLGVNSVRQLPVVGQVQWLVFEQGEHGIRIPSLEVGGKHDAKKIKGIDNKQSIARKHLRDMFYEQREQPVHVETSGWQDMQSSKILQEIQHMYRLGKSRRFSVWALQSWKNNVPNCQKSLSNFDIKQHFVCTTDASINKSIKFI